jgi:hypothetical protein
MSQVSNDNHRPRASWHASGHQPGRTGENVLSANEPLSTVGTGGMAWNGREYAGSLAGSPSSAAKPTWAQAQAEAWRACFSKGRCSPVCTAAHKQTGMRRRYMGSQPIKVPPSAQTREHPLPSCWRAPCWAPRQAAAPSSRAARRSSYWWPWRGRSGTMQGVEQVGGVEQDACGTGLASVAPAPWREAERGRSTQAGGAQ